MPLPDFSGLRFTKEFHFIEESDRCCDFIDYFSIDRKLINYLCYQALSTDISLTHLWAIIPQIYLTAMIPFSIIGIGIRDSAFVFFFTLLGYSAEEGLAVSITLISMRYLVGISGGGLVLREFLLGRKIL